MDLQLIEVYLKHDDPSIVKKLNSFPHIQFWKTEQEADLYKVGILVEKENTEDVLNYLDLLSDRDKTFNAIVLSVDTYLPRDYKEKNEDEKKEKIERASKQELVAAVLSLSQLNISFVVFSLFAALVAVGGIVKDSAAFIVGANIIDPSFNPLLGLSFASVLGEKRIARETLWPALVSLLIPFSFAVLYGLIFPLPLKSTEYLSLTDIQVIDTFLALAAGGAGALSFAKKMNGQLVGVMVSLTVLPPTIVLGMMTGAHLWRDLLNPLVLLLTNINAILFSAIVVFWVSGIKPTNWSEIKEAHVSREASIIVTGIIGVLLILTVIYLHIWRVVR